MATPYNGLYSMGELYSIKLYSMRSSILKQWIKYCDQCTRMIKGLKYKAKAVNNILSTINSELTLLSLNILDTVT